MTNESNATTEIPAPGDSSVLAQEPAPAVEADNVGKPRSLWDDAWDELRRKPMFWIPAVLITILVVMAVAPQLFASGDPTSCDLKVPREAPSGQHWFGTDLLGCDVYTRTIYGARASIMVGLLATICTTLLGSFIGIVSAFFGGWIDTLLSRLGEIFFAIPLLLGGIVVLYSLPKTDNFFLIVAKVVLALTILGWPSIARLMRSSVLQVVPNEYVMAARALGASPLRIITAHILPNAVAPVIAVATINLGAYIAIEATLSFLGIGLQMPTVSWGVDISAASGLGYIQSAPHMLLFPSLFLSLTVLAFIMLGEAVRDAIDPKQR